MFSLPVKPKMLTASEKAQYEQVMRAGNTRLQFWHEQVKDELDLNKKFTRSRFRAKIFGIVDDPNFQEIESEMSDHWKLVNRKVTSIIKRIPRADIVKIVAVRDIELDVMAGYIRMVADLADKWNRREHDSSVTLNDLISEGSLKLHESIYYYTKEVQFITFAWHAVNRKMTSLCTKTTMLCDRTNEITSLLQAYEAARKSFNGPCNNEEIYRKMKITDEEKMRLEAARMSVIAQSSLDIFIPLDEGEDDGDYTHFASNLGDFNSAGHQHGVGRILVNRSEESRVDKNTLRNILDKANLDDFERTVVKQWLDSGDDRWRAAFADSYRGPGNRQYTRAWVSQTLQRAQFKLKRAAEELHLV
jgi:hypothetical protein